jgi:hypothetical protein
MHDGRFHDLEQTPVVRSTRLAVASASVGFGAGAEDDTEDDAGAGEDASVQQPDTGGGGLGGEGSDQVPGGHTTVPVVRHTAMTAKAAAAFQQRQHDSYLRRGGVASAWIRAPPSFTPPAASYRHRPSLASSTPTHGGDGIMAGRGETDHNHPEHHGPSPTSASTSNAKRWVALSKTGRSPPRVESAQELEARVVYGGENADVKGAGLDIEGIEEEDKSRSKSRASGDRGGARGQSGGAGATPAVISGGGSGEIRLGGDRLGVGVLAKNKGGQSQHGGAGGSMLRGGAADSFKRDSERGWFVF